MRILANERLHEALDLCVECKGCKAECQTGVDMAKLKYEFLAAYKQAHGASLRDRLFAHARTAGRVGAAFQPLASRLAASASARGLLERFTGIDRRRALPPFARQTLRRWWDQRSRTSSSHPLSAGGEGPHEVVLFSDTFMNYHHPEVGIAAVEVLERTGLRVHLLDPACCGRPMLSRGFMDEAARNAQANVDALAAFASRGVPILGIEPSCLLALRDEYPDMLQDEPSRLVARNTYLVDEYLAILKEQGKLSLPFGQVQKKVLFHGHCHQKALAGTARSLAVLRLPPGYTVEEVQSGCCGMAGAFGYEKEHYDVSLAMGRLRLAPAIEAKGPEWEVAVTGVSCRQQVEHLTGRKARHLIEVLRDAVA